eukprot:SAG22_NODE_740_length_7513_cov_2.826409_4_plen_617_part_00
MERTEIARKLSNFLAQGGNVIITRDSLRNLKNGLAGVTAPEFGCKEVPSNTHIAFVGTSRVLTEPFSFELCPLTLPADATVLATTGSGEPVAASVNSGGCGFLTVLAAGSHGISTVRLPEGPNRRGCGPFSRTTSSTSPGQWPGPRYSTPAPITLHVSHFLNQSLSRTALFDLGSELAWIPKHVSNGTEYVIAVLNPGPSELPLQITSLVGMIVSLDELPTDLVSSVLNTSTVGWLPAGYEHRRGGPLGRNSNRTIAGGDIRVFRVTVDRSTRTKPLTLIPPSLPVPPPPTVFLRLPHTISHLRHEILRRPSFKVKFSGVMIDAAYVHSQTHKQLQIEGNWLYSRNIGVVVDISRLIQFHPYPPVAFRLFDYLPAEYNKSLAFFEDVISKLPDLGARDLVMSLHPRPEAGELNVVVSVQRTLAFIASSAAKVNATVHLRQCFKNEYLVPGGIRDGGQKLAAYAGAINATNLRVAASTAFMVQSTQPNDPPLGKKGSLLAPGPTSLLLVNGFGFPAVDDYGSPSGFLFNNMAVAVASMNETLQAETLAHVRAAVAQGGRIVLDAGFPTTDDELDEMASLSPLSIKSDDIASSVSKSIFTKSIVGVDFSDPLHVKELS